MTIFAQRVFAPVWVIVSQSIIVYYTLIRHSHPLRQISRFRRLYFRSLPYGMVWAADESFPAFRLVFLPHVPSPLRQEEDWVHVPSDTFPNPTTFPMERLGRLLPRPDTGFCRENMTTL
jgi:hypothetical protein